MKMNNIDQIRLLYWWKLIEQKMFPLHVAKDKNKLGNWLQLYKNYITSNHKYIPNPNEIKIKNFSFEWHIEPNLNFNLRFRFERDIFKVTSSTLNSLKYENISDEINYKLSQLKNELFTDKDLFIERVWELIGDDIYDDEILKYSTGISHIVEYDSKYLSEMDYLPQIFGLNNITPKDKDIIKKKPNKGEIKKILTNFIVHPAIHNHIESLSHNIRTNFNSKNPFYILYQLAFQFIDIEKDFNNSALKQKEFDRLVSIVEKHIDNNLSVSSGELFNLNK